MEGFVNDADMRGRDGQDDRMDGDEATEGAESSEGRAA